MKLFVKKIGELKQMLRERKRSAGGENTEGLDDPQFKVYSAAHYLLNGVIKRSCRSHSNSR